MLIFYKKECKMESRGDIMLYQNLHLGDPPYLLNSTNAIVFPTHTHVEIELFYCIKGDYKIVVDRKRYSVMAGELVIIGSMIPHEVVGSEDRSSRCVVLEIGPAMLGEYFSPIENQAFPNPVFDLRQEKYRNLYELFNEAARLYKESTAFSSLLVKGNIYKISAYILKEFVSENNGSTVPKRLNSIKAVEKSLEFIYNNYSRRLTVEEVAASCGYSKSNFCKIFKNITNDTYHNFLNKYRIKMACTLLKSSDYSVEEIATRVGFADSKSFCRIFKLSIGITPGQYRKG